MSTVVNLRDFPPRIALGPDGKFHKGRHLPPDVVSVTRPSRWGNPYKIGARRVYLLGRYGAGASDSAIQYPSPITREQAIEWFAGYAHLRLLHDPTWLDPLRGKRLACWCAPAPCHADVLASLIAETAGA